MFTPFQLINKKRIFSSSALQTRQQSNNHMFIPLSCLLSLSSLDMIQLFMFGLITWLNYPINIINLNQYYIYLAPYQLYWCWSMHDWRSQKLNPMLWLNGGCDGTGGFTYVPRSWHLNDPCMQRTMIDQARSSLGYSPNEHSTVGDLTSSYNCTCVGFRGQKDFTGACKSYTCNVQYQYI